MGAGRGIPAIIGPHRGEVLRLARRYGARRIRVFGSVRRAEADPQSDLDLRVDRERGTSLLDTAGFRVALGGLIGRRVPTAEARYLHWAIQAQVLAEAIPL